MGLFSKKKESHSIEEAIANDDCAFEYTTKTGNTYHDIPGTADVIRAQSGFQSSNLDDMYEMFAPNLTTTIDTMAKNIETLLEQNKHLEKKVDALERELHASPHNTRAL